MHINRTRPLPPPTNPSPQAEPRQQNNYEPIRADLICCICGSPEDDAAMLVCEGCLDGYHLWCVWTRVPKDDCFCPHCVHKRGHGPKG